MSPVHDVLSTGGRQEGVQAAVDAVRRGELVVLPTDTVYGVGADAFDAVAVQRLLEAKGRGRQMPPPVLVADAGTIDALAIEIPDYARALVRRFWPGPLTLVLRAQPSLAWDLGDTNGTVALRMPDHEITLELLAQTGPLAVSSANRTGRPAAESVAEAAAQLGPAVEVYLDGGPARPGESAVTLASTIVDCTRDRPVVLRPGPITVAQVEAEAGVAVAAGGLAAQPDPPTSGDPAPSGDPATSGDPTPSGDHAAYGDPTAQGDPTAEPDRPGR